MSTARRPPPSPAAGAVADVDAREARLRDAVRRAAALPRAGTSEGRQLRRWLTQLIVTERVVAAEAAARGLTAGGAPPKTRLLPDDDRRDWRSAVLPRRRWPIPLARAMFAARHGRGRRHRRRRRRLPRPQPVALRGALGRRNGWRPPRRVAPPLDEVRPAIAEHLRGAARRRAFRLWLDARRAELVRLAPGYEHPGDPRQPDNTHRH